MSKKGFNLSRCAIFKQLWSEMGNKCRSDYTKYVVYGRFYFKSYRKRRSCLKNFWQNHFFIIFIVLKIFLLLKDRRRIWGFGWSSQVVYLRALPGSDIFALWRNFWHGFLNYGTLKAPSALKNCCYLFFVKKFRI